MIVGILQARMSSRRLPGKIMADLHGSPMIMHQIERLKVCSKLDELIIATSEHFSDDVLESYCIQNNIRCYRGALDDVLDRYYKASLSYSADHIVRLTADCPLIDAGIVDEVIDQHLKEDADYTSNTLTYTFPDGLDVEIMKASALEKTWNEAVLASEREHVTIYIKNHPDRFKLSEFKSELPLSELRWTVDEKDDLEFVNCIYKALYDKKPHFDMSDILDFLKLNPLVEKINHKFIRNEGLELSIKNDKVCSKR